MCLGFVLSLKGPTFGCIFSSKYPLMTSKIKIFGQNLLNLVLRGHFWPFWGSKKSIPRFFQSFLVVALDVFGLCFKPERAYF